MEKEGKRLDNDDREENTTERKKRRVSRDLDDERIEKRSFCKYFAKGNCTKGNECPFLHKRQVCKYWLQGNCSNKGFPSPFSHSQECEFLHKYKNSRVPQCYFDRTRGECHNPGCMFLHLNHKRKRDERVSLPSSLPDEESLSLGSQQDLPETQACQACHELSKLQKPSGLWDVDERWASLLPHSFSAWIPPQLSTWLSNSHVDEQRQVTGRVSFLTRKVWGTAITLEFLEREKNEWQGKLEAVEIERAKEKATLTLCQKLTDNSLPKLLEIARKLLR